MLLEADDDKTKPPDSSTNNENELLGTETTNGNCEKIEHEMENDDDDQKQADPQKASEASANKLEMFQEKQKFIEEQNRKRKEMLSKVNLKRREICKSSMSVRQFWTGKSRPTRRVGSCK